jgi:hypothetical protein
MIPGIESYVKCFSFIFTKVPENELSVINAKLFDIYSREKSENNSDSGYLIVLHQMIE